MNIFTSILSRISYHLIFWINSMQKTRVLFGRSIYLSFIYLVIYLLLNLYIYLPLWYFLDPPYFFQDYRELICSLSEGRWISFTLTTLYPVHTVTKQELNLNLFSWVKSLDHNLRRCYLSGDTLYNCYSSETCLLLKVKK